VSFNRTEVAIFDLDLTGTELLAITLFIGIWVLLALGMRGRVPLSVFFLVSIAFVVAGDVVSRDFFEWQEPDEAHWTATALKASAGQFEVIVPAMVGEKMAPGEKPENALSIDQVGGELALSAIARDTPLLSGQVTSNLQNFLNSDPASQAEASERALSGMSGAPARTPTPPLKRPAIVTVNATQATLAGKTLKPGEYVTVFVSAPRLEADPVRVPQEIEAIVLQIADLAGPTQDGVIATLTLAIRPDDGRRFAENSGGHVVVVKGLQ
jgi:hypothetical protein